MNILVLFEYSGIARDAIAIYNENTYSCDLLPSESQGKHLQCDYREALVYKNWDMLIAHPPCTYLSSSGLHHNLRNRERRQKTEDALKLVQDLFDLDIRYKAIENPIGCISTRLRKHTQIVQPYEYGDDASKATCLWLENLPPLRPTKYIEPRTVYRTLSDGSKVPEKRWGNQRDDGHPVIKNNKNRAKNRAKTFPGLAQAFAEQWVKPLIS